MQGLGGSFAPSALQGPSFTGGAYEPEYTPLPDSTIDPYSLGASLLSYSPRGFPTQGIFNPNSSFAASGGSMPGLNLSLNAVGGGASTESPGALFGANSLMSQYLSGGSSGTAGPTININSPASSSSNSDFSQQLLQQDQSFQNQLQQMMQRLFQTPQAPASPSQAPQATQAPSSGGYVGNLNSFRNPQGSAPPGNSEPGLNQNAVQQGTSVWTSTGTTQLAPGEQAYTGPGSIYNPNGLGNYTGPGSIYNLA